jgi:signal transduction histidine kinase
MFISVLSLFIECWVVFNNTRNLLHAYLLLSIISALMSNLGYILELQSTTLGGYLAAVKFSYAGRIWLAFALLQFAAQFCHIKIPAVIRKTLPIIHMAVYGVILTIGSNDLYYKNIAFSMDDGNPVLIRENGIVHHFLIQLQIVYIICAFIWFFSTLRRQNGPTARKRYWTVIIAYVIQTVFYLAQISGVFPISKVFDLLIVGNTLMTFFMYVAIFKYNLLGVIDIARDFIVERLSEGVIAVDKDGKVRYFNEPARALYPELTEKPEEVVWKIKDAIKRGDTIRSNDRIYTPEENELMNKDENLGKLYALVDTTVLKLQEYKLKSDAEILEVAANTMRERLLTAEELMQLDRAMRHDRRHFEALLLSLIRDDKIDEARKCLEERMAQEPRSASRYCENATVNAAITHYVSHAENKNIEVKVSANIPVKLNVDEMQLAITISNLLENAIHGCENLPAENRRIELTAKYKEQLLLEITNTCEGMVPLDEDGHPFAAEADHGIGTKSVLAFAEKTDSDIIYIAEEGLFRVRMIIN